MSQPPRVKVYTGLPGQQRLLGTMPRPERYRLPAPLVLPVLSETGPEHANVGPACRQFVFIPETWTVDDGWARETVFVLSVASSAPARDLRLVPGWEANRG